MCSKQVMSQSGTTIQCMQNKTMSILDGVKKLCVYDL